MRPVLSVCLVVLVAVVASALVGMLTGPRKPIVVRIQLEGEPETVMEALEEYSEASARLIELVDDRAEMGCNLSELVSLIEAAQNATERAWAALRERIHEESYLSNAEDDQEDDGKRT